MPNFRFAKYGNDPAALSVDDPNAPLNLFGGTFLYKQLPGPSNFRGIIFVPDVGIHGSFWYSDGTTYGLVNGSCVLSQSAVPVSCSASTAEEVLQQVPIFGSLLGLNGALRLTTLFTISNNANTKTIRARFGTTALGGSAWLANQSTTVASLNYLPQVLRNRNAVNSQITYVPANGGNTTSSGNANGTFTEDSSVDNILAITGQKAVAGDVLTLEGYTLELLRP